METAKLPYLTNLGNKVDNPVMSQKSYWKIINRVMNKCRAPKIPPLLVNNLFILNCREKHDILMTIFYNSVSQILRFLTNKRINHVTIANDEIISLIPKINPNKAKGRRNFQSNVTLIC